jgi:hypothetical protein
MKEYYYCLDGHTTDGPHSEKEIAELSQSGVLKPETYVCAAGDKEWTLLKNTNLNLTSAQVVAVVPAPGHLPQDSDIVKVDHSAVASAGNDTDGEEDKEEKEKQDEDKGLGKYQLIRAIRADLDLLWKAQRESLISRVRGLELEPSYETTRKQAKAIKDRVKQSCLLYWKKSKSYDAWIEELVWRDCDIQRRLRGDGCEEKYEDARKWLTEAKLIDEAGCYCFKEGKQYLYIGKAGAGEYTLGRRLHDHRRSVFFEHATHLRIIIPRYKTWISRLERLLLLNYPDAQYNDATPAMGHNSADEILELLASEMDDLLTDG